MGHGIAYVALAAGCPVQLFDVSQGVLEGAAASIRTLAEKAVERQWTIDDVVVGDTDFLGIDTSAWQPRTYAIQVVVRDTTPAVRKDPASVLYAQFRWQVTAVR